MNNPSGSVVRHGDNLTGEGGAQDGDDENISVYLNKVPQQRDKLVFVLNIYKCDERGQTLDSVKNLYIKLYDPDSKKTLIQYRVNGNMANDTALVIGIAEENRTHTPCGEYFSRLSPNLVLQDAYLASTRFDKIHQKIQRRRVLCSFARANILQMQGENAKQYKILRAFYLPQVQILAAQNRMSSVLFGYGVQEGQLLEFQGDRS